MNDKLTSDAREQSAVMIVDDNPVDRMLFGELIDVGADYAQGELLQAASCEEAQQLLEKYQPSCCLIDYMMPGANGAEFIKSIRQQENNQHIPIIMMTGEGDEKVAVDIMRSGAQDYLIKGEITKELLNHSIKSAIQTCQLQGQLQYLAHYDILTGLLNRALFLDRLQSAIDKCNRYKNSCSVLYIDVDDFKYINDYYGHYEGDEILKAIATRMKESCRNTDSPARLGGDEFAILLDCINEEDTNKTAEKILRAVSLPILVGDRSITISLSIGIAYYPKTATNMQELLQQADEAMYQTKQSGKAGCSFFSEKHGEQWKRLKQLEIMLPLAIKGNELTLAYQPIVKAEDRSLYGLEVLARWNPPGFTVSAQELVDMVEKLGLFDMFHTWLINTALSQYAQWHAVGRDVQYCLNIPANHSHSEWLIHCLHDALNVYDIEPFHISLEITEKTLMSNREMSSQLLASLHNEGVQFSLEDFGAGNISVSHLSTLPFSTLKIDHQFIKGIDENKANRKVVEAMIALGHSLELSVVAEGVETEEEYNTVKDIGCDLMQGFYFGKPAVAIDIWDGFVNRSTEVNA
jgi:diguanylate cyclase (GGDEF)-like protein